MKSGAVRVTGAADGGAGSRFGVAPWCGAGLKSRDDGGMTSGAAPRENAAAQPGSADYGTGSDGDQHWTADSVLV